MKNKFNPHILNLGSINRLENNNTMYYIVGMVVRWDAKKAATNLKKHGIAFEEAVAVLFNDRTIEIEDMRHREHRFIIIGISVHTRLLTVVYAYRYEDEIRIISARKSTRNEEKKYEERI